MFFCRGATASKARHVAKDLRHSVALPTMEVVMELDRPRQVLGRCVPGQDERVRDDIFHELLVMDVGRVLIDGGIDFFFVFLCCVCVVLLFSFVF